MGYIIVFHYHYQCSIFLIKNYLITQFYWLFNDFDQLQLLHSHLLHSLKYFQTLLLWKFWQSFLSFLSILLMSINEFILNPISLFFCFKIMASYIHHSITNSNGLVWHFLTSYYSTNYTLNLLDLHLNIFLWS